MTIVLTLKQNEELCYRISRADKILFAQCDILWRVLSGLCAQC